MNKYWYFGCLKNERLWGETKKIFFSGLQSYKPDRKGGPGSQLSRPVHKAGVLHKILSGDNFMYLLNPNNAKIVCPQRYQITFETLRFPQFIVMILYVLV